MLRGSHLVVLRFCRHAQLPKLFVYIIHICTHTLPDDAEIMVIQFLSLWRHGAEQRASRIDQVFPLLELLGVNQEVFLLRAYGRIHTLCGGVSKEAQDP